MRTACYFGANATVKRRCHGWNALIGAIRLRMQNLDAKGLNAVTDYILRYTYIMLPMGRIAEGNRPKNGT
ncbi:hypothetical protein DPMN_181403 [Dreissena polymorpha]|uniref:Uncharacterized protein n=1 Tax=Dreissena polymorpha TaxID=45954 RepID=A0A9D4DE40_DREPO|nr:hypothetical protein DPMN_181403 [Dreissena polymorpha]